MPDIAIDEAEGLSARDLVHTKLTATPAAATIGELRAFFAASANRRLAVLVDDGRFAGLLAPADVPASGADAAPVRDHARPGPTVAADAPAAEALAAALGEESRRVPVVEADGTLVGVVALDADRRHFCGTG